jgi:carnitine O-palmitoyltransferase 1
METIRPLVTKEEYADLEAQRIAFMSNEGPKLQRYLKLKHMYADNYITDWWLNIVYLRGRDSLTINSNYFCTGRVHAPPTTHQASRAAKVVHLFVKAKLEIDHEELPPQLMQGIVPICMNQYLSAFSTTREPHHGEDKLVSYDSRESRHIVVIHRGRMYSVDCFSQRSRRPLTAKQLERTLQGIIDDESATDPIEAAIPVLTNLGRDEWADIREKCFQCVAGNDKALEVIEKALFVLALDDFSPKDLNEEGLNYFIGDYGKNRWVDKSFHVIITKDAKLGIEAEHSWGDAPALGHIFELALAREITEDPYDEKGFVKKDYRDLRKERTNKESFYPAQRIRFNVTPALAAHVNAAVPIVKQQLGDLEYKLLYFETFGRGLVKKAKCGPDPWVQMALQLAYFRDQGRFDQTYESGMTRLFKYGRTETIRTVSDDSCAWVRSMDDVSVSREERIRLLRKACDTHQETSSRAMVGQGIDRHLFALYVVSFGAKIPSTFLENILKRKWKLSTSQVLQRQTVPGTWPGNDGGDLYPLPSGGFGPVADDGYGICYCFVGEHRIALHVTSKISASNTKTARFVSHLDQALIDMRKLFPDIPDKPAASNKKDA